ncbi:hypothetical protein [Longimicrobium terrae]|uniref:SMODS and SLOG-associating 2TM effector domain-containing protein n=1 Tax=Longimicrobium terrae TaxID=1639882 RepID=A0A841GS80_9BACT|nr:hypothetical protein [Longimicrobium terrae]MBB4635696.1 hypothetical protein [Longimicrobium terrae]MBB6070090.1 hypothetical protein [Longimicrobium terrae]NNC32993.1 hypothetical protein [Longimicrobium terrae]
MQPESGQDELDKISIDQLHKAVLQLSGNCFEIKKLCATVLVSASTLVTTFTNRQLDASLFVGGGVITLFFWMLDGQSYYYQEKLRAQMKKLAEHIADRDKQKVTVLGVGMPLTEERENWNVVQRSFHAAFNGSMLFYVLLLIIMLGLGTLYSVGGIAANSPSR